MSLIVIAPLMLNCCEARDTLVLVVALLCIAVRGVFVGLAVQTWMVFAAVGVGAFGGIANSVLKSLASQYVDLEEQGQTFALFAGTETVAKIVGSVGFTLLYSLTCDVFPGLLFLFMGAVAACLIPLVLVVHRCRPKRHLSALESFSEEI
jgi:MFS-type transporter involved in bile tolerance (Atg22 family)